MTSKGFKRIERNSKESKRIQNNLKKFNVNSEGLKGVQKMYRI